MNILSGFQAHDTVQLLLRIVLGLFFVLARFRFFYDPSKQPCLLNDVRHTSLTNKMQHCGWQKWPAFWAWFVACVEVFAGLGVLAGLLTTIAAFGLMVITLMGTLCTAKSKVMEQHPVDKLDYVSCYLWRVEGIYILIAAMILLGGPGAYSFDALVGLT